MLAVCCRQVVDNRELDAIGLAAAFGHLAKLHAMAGPDSTMPRQLKCAAPLLYLIDDLMMVHSQPPPSMASPAAMLLLSWHYYCGSCGHVACSGTEPSCSH